MLHLPANIKLIRLLTGKTQEGFGALFEATKAMIVSYEKGKANPDDLFISRLSKFATVSVDDLKNKLLAEGDIKITKVEKVEKLENSTSEHSPDYQTQRREQKLNGENGSKVPVFEDAPATLSNIESYRDVKIDRPDFWITIPGLRNCNYGCRAIGDSMEPLIRSHALVVGEEITDFSFILYDEIYIIRAKNGIETVKYIQPDDGNPDYILLVPFNKGAKTTPLHRDDILRLYRARAVFNIL